MADATAFKRVCGELEAGTALSALEARGTVRLALKQAGFDAKSVNAQQMSVVVRKVLPGELSLRGIQGGENLCEHIAHELGTCADEPATAESPEDVFRRLGGLRASPAAGGAALTKSD
jgi:hypothetical protein